MERLAYALIAVGFIGGSFVAVLDPNTVAWGPFAAPVGAGLAGVLLLRRARHEAARVDDKLDAGVETLRTSLANIARGLEELATRDALPPYEVRFEIDRMFRADLTAFADARECMVHRFSLKDYADIMSAFAAGERYINRVWSASTDGYVDEVNAYLARARDQFAEAQAAFARVEAGANA